MILISHAVIGPSPESFKSGSHLAQLPCKTHLNISLQSHLNRYLNVFSQSSSMILKYYWIYFILSSSGLWHHSLVNGYWYVEEHAALTYSEDGARMFLRNVGHLPKYNITTHITTAQILTAMKTSNLILDLLFCSLYWQWCCWQLLCIYTLSLPSTSLENFMCRRKRKRWIRNVMTCWL
jgi:hypothetical protein